MKFTESIFKAYDVRGISGEELTVAVARAYGRAVADYLPHQGPVIVGRDMRMDSNDLAAAVIEGLTEQGRDVWDVGLVTTDMVYFAAGRFEEMAGGIMVTASHNPGKYNGIKLVGHGSVPMGASNGLLDIKQKLIDDDFAMPADEPGTVTERSINTEWVEQILKFVDVPALKPYKIAVDAGNGMGGAIFPDLAKKLPFTVDEMYFELDGTFPNHVANPKLRETLNDLCARIREKGLDFGLAFDGDGDRGGVVDETGEPVPEYAMGAMLAAQFLKDNPGGSVVYDLRVSHLVPDVVTKLGGKAIRSKVGNDAIKTLMRQHEAVLGIEASGHYYFRDDYYSDSGIIAVMSIVSILAQSGKKLSELVREYTQGYATAEEENFEVADAAAVRERLREAFADGQQDMLDGLTVDYPDWWFNLRASNTEPVVRLNIEAKDAATLQAKRAEVVKLIGGKVHG
ncbi:MAG TPA: phosphomannomutase/phosphoglucomutase [Candidatus Saccharimonadia bacterium]